MLYRYVFICKRCVETFEIQTANCHARFVSIQNLPYFCCVSVSIGLFWETYWLYDIFVKCTTQSSGIFIVTLNGSWYHKQHIKNFCFDKKLDCVVKCVIKWCISTCSQSLRTTLTIQFENHTLFVF